MPTHTKLSELYMDAMEKDYDMDMEGGKVDEYARKRMEMDAMEMDAMEMEGGKLYTVKDIVSGPKKSPQTLKNGAIAGYVMINGEKKWRIVKGANKAYMKKIRREPRGAKPITNRQAVIAFNKHYRGKSAKSRSYDKKYTTQPVVSDRRYLRAPGKYDFAGVDAGPKTRKGVYKNARSPSQKEKDKARMANIRPKSMEGGAVDLKQAVKLLRSYYDQKYN